MLSLSSLTHSLPPSGVRYKLDEIQPLLGGVATPPERSVVLILPAGQLARRHGEHVQADPERKDHEGIVSAKTHDK